MASDNRDVPAPPAQQAPKSSQPVYLWSHPVDTQGSASNGAEAGKAGSSNATGRPTLADAVATIKADDFVTFAQTPCVRGSLVTGITTGAAFGGLAFVVKGSLPRAANWSVGMFLLGSTASYEYCQYRRRAERLQMKRSIEIVTEKRREAEQRRIMAEAGSIRAQREQEAKRPWYKFW